MNRLGIYIHTPFCAKKCPYCDFYSTGYNKENVLKFTDAVIRNIRFYGDKSNMIDTVYFGGGTPSLLPADCIKQILDEIKTNFKMSVGAEITIEANPSTVNEKKLRDFFGMGINRLSIGVQSLIDSELKLLGRGHNSKTAIDTIITAKKIGFENISCDVMIGLPNQNVNDIKYTLSNLIKQPITHVSAYILKVEEGTPFDNIEMLESMPDDDLVSDFYLEMADMLEENKIMQYEISNFAKKGFESKHNNKYWKCEDYLGIGPMAHSCYNGKRFFVPTSLDDFIKSERQEIEITDDSPCSFEEIAMLKLRLKEGLDLTNFEEHRKNIEEKLPMLIKGGYINFDGNVISLTKKGFLMSNTIIGKIL